MVAVEESATRSDDLRWADQKILDRIEVIV